MSEVFNETKATSVATNVRIATSMWSRFWGLMLHGALSEDEGLLIKPCSSVHMFFMRFPLDIVYLNKESIVVKVVPNLKPWRMSLGGRGAHSALELPAGTAARAGIEFGDQLRIAD